VAHHDRSALGASRLGRSAARRLSSGETAADNGGVDPTCFPWRPLGALLVERGLLTEARLEQAMAEQRRSGRLLGVILVESGYLSGVSLARALAEQHGVELRTPGEGSGSGAVSRLERVRGSRTGPTGSAPGEDGWRPLGVLLVEWGYLERAELEGALAEQRQRPGRRLGEILVGLGYLSGPDLARALALQHGVDVPERELDARLDTVIVPSLPGQTVYLVHEVVFDPDYRTGSVLYESTNLLEAAEFALEYVDEHEPKALAIQRASGAARETVWTYSEARAAGLPASRTRPVETFGFDPVRWGSGPARRQ
jgi:hypothetical protein